MGQSPPGLAGVSGTALSPLLLAELPKPISLPRITQLFPLPLGFGKVRTSSQVVWTEPRTVSKSRGKFGIQK